MSVKQIAALTAHRLLSTGRDNILDPDLTALVEEWPDLAIVFEEVQYLRVEYQRLIGDNDLLMARLSDYEPV
jgi:hypothetical protein